MAAQPTDDAIDQFSQIAAISRSEAIERLKRNNNSLEQAADEYFQTLTSSQHQWVESDFNSERDGTSNQNGMSFNIQGPDVESPYFGGQIGAPSRPPSRASHNKSPHNQVTDLSASHAVAGPNASQFDQDTQEALVKSVEEGNLAPQQSGITDTVHTQFGPANRSDYEPNPEPPERKRDLDAPACLKPSIEDHRLGALLTIYHEIPIAREIFLQPQRTLSDYGHDKEWWNGKTIETPTISEDGRSESDAGDRFYAELQRIMAFLDKTDRSYGSAEVLTKFPIMRKLSATGSMETAFFEAWQSFWGNPEEAREENNAEFQCLFSRGVPSEEAKYDQGKDFAILRLDLPEKSSSLETMYDLADQILWNSRLPFEIAASPYLSHLGEVIAFQLEGNESSKSVQIPLVWYPDRYIKSEREAALRMRQKQAEIKEQFERIAILENKLTNYNPPSGEAIEVSKLLQRALQHDEAELAEGDLRVDQASEDSTDVEMMVKPRKYDLSAELRKVMESIDGKLLALSEEKERAQATLRQLSKLYTEPSEDQKEPPFHPYTLRGVVTTKNTTYVCRHSEPALIDIDLDGDGSVRKGDQWWKINFSSLGTSHVTVEKTTEAEVLEAAMNESKNTILVYASSAAMTRPVVPLPKALENFVRTDNLAFSDEFPRSESQSDDVFSSPKSPGKRKYEDSEGGSPAQNRWAGDSPLRYENPVKSARPAVSSDQHATSNQDVLVGIDPFQLVDGEPGQEMQERGNLRMSMLAAKRNESTVGGSDMDIDQVV